MKQLSARELNSLRTSIIREIGRQAIGEVTCRPNVEADALRFMALPTRIRALVREVAERHEINPFDICGQSRLQKICLARFEVWSILSEEAPKKTLNQIGRMFGRDHTSVLYGIRRHREGASA
jgi:chromosomal replication initiation ATPase DnaA